MQNVMQTLTSSVAFLPMTGCVILFFMWLRLKLKTRKERIKIDYEHQISEDCRDAEFLKERQKNVAEIFRKRFMQLGNKLLEQQKCITVYGCESTRWSLKRSDVEGEYLLLRDGMLVWASHWDYKYPDLYDILPYALEIERLLIHEGAVSARQLLNYTNQN